MNGLLRPNRLRKTWSLISVGNPIRFGSLRSFCVTVVFKVGGHSISGVVHLGTRAGGCLLTGPESG
jgi:hypothetical protein